MTLRFSDGVNIDTSGELRRLEMADGLYVVGKGYLVPVDSESAVLATIAMLDESKRN